MEIVEKNPFEQLDQYELRHFVEHLKDANRFEDAHRILLEENILIVKQHSVSNAVRKWLGDLLKIQPPQKKFSRNAWHTAQQKIGEVHNFVKDVQLCWKLAETESRQSIKNDLKATSIDLEVRYALISASLNNLASNIPHSLILRLLQTNFLTIKQALTYAEQIPDLSQKVLFFLIIGLNANSPLQEELFEEALRILKSIHNDIKQSEIIAKAVQIVLPPLVSDELTKIAQNISYSKSRAEALLSLYPSLTELFKNETSEQILAAAKEISNQADRQIILINAARVLRCDLQEELLESVLNEIRSLKYEYQKAEVIAKFVEVAPDKYLLRVRVLIYELKDAQHRAAGELSLVGRLAAKGDLEAATAILKQFDDIAFEKQYAFALIKMAFYVEELQMPRILRLISKMFSEHHRSDVLVSYIPYLSKQLVEQLIGVWRRMRETDPKTKLLCSIAARLATLSSFELLEDAVTAVSETNLSQPVKDEAINILAPHLSGQLLEKLFSSIQKISDLKQQIITIASYSGYLPVQPTRSAIIREEIFRAKKIVDEEERHEAMTELLIRLAEIGHFEEALQIAFGFRLAKWKARALSKIFIHVPKQSRAEIYKLILQHWKKQSDQSATDEIISNLVTYLSSAMVLETIAMIQSLDNESNRISSFISLLPKVSIEMLREKVIPELSNIGNDFFADSRSQAFTIAIARRLAQLDMQDEAFELAVSVTESSSSPTPYPYEAIISYLPMRLLWRVYEESKAFSYEGARHWIYKTLAPRFVELGDEVTATRLIAEIKMPMQRALAHAAIVPFATGTLKIESIRQVLQTIEFVQQSLGNYEEVGQSESLGNLAKYFSSDQLRRAWLYTLKIEPENERQDALCKLSERIVSLPLREIYWFWTAALHQLSTRSRENLLTDLQSLAPLVAIIGDEISVTKIIQNIHLVNNWWEN